MTSEAPGGHREEEGSSESLKQRIIELVEAARAGERSALEELFALHEPMMMRWARRRLGQSLRTMDETRDVLHDAYHVVMQKIDVFEVEDSRSFARWLRGIVTRIVLSKARDPRVKRRDPLLDEHEVKDLDMTPMSRVSFDEVLKLRYRILREFPREDRLAWRLRRRGFSNRQIAEHMGVTDRAVRQRFAKLDARLQLRLKPYLEASGDAS